MTESTPNELIDNRVDPRPCREKTHGALVGNGRTEFDEPHTMVEGVEMKPPTQTAKRNWKGLLLAFIVISVISAFIVLASFLTFDNKVETNYGLPLTLDDIFMLNGLINRPNAQFSNDQLVYLSLNGSLLAVDLKTHRTRMLMSNGQLREKQNFTGIVSVSEDMTRILLRYLYIPIYRRSYYSQYQAVLLSKDPNPQVLSRIDVGPLPNALEQPLLNHAQFSPKSDDLVFVHKNQIYCLRDPFNLSLEGSRLTPVTKNIPSKEGVLYGVSGFVYEEEILGSSQAFWWNPTGDKLAFAAIDESNVTKTNLLLFETPDQLLPQFLGHSYPMAGETKPYNMPVLAMYVHLLESNENIEFQRPPTVPMDAYMTFFKWINNERFVCGWVSRRWEEAWIVVGDVLARSMSVVFQDRARFGWINLPNQLLNMPIVESDKQSMLIVLPNYYSSSVFRGIARIFLNKSSTETYRYPQWVHTPDYDVKDILYTFGTNEILYLASGQKTMDMHLFLTRKGGSGASPAVCLTCGDPHCRYNTAKVSNDGSHILVECQGPSPPKYVLTRLVKNGSVEPEGSNVYLETISVISNNTRVKEIISSKAMPVVKFRNVTIRKGTKYELTLQAKFIQPPELKETHITQYPLLLETYGGPISQVVTAKFSLDWKSYLATRFKFVSVSIDGRGTWGRGKKFEAAIYKNLGVVEIMDQIDGLRQILQEHQYLNRSKICSFGWSYGGFVVANILGNSNNDIINCGVAVAPVTDFKLYASAYTERFLGLYSENTHEYTQTRISQFARNFKNKDFLIIHGMADDNVNLINSALLIKELIREGIEFEMMYYPDDNHFITQRHFRQHLWRKVIIFIVDSINKTSIRHRRPFDEM